MSHILGSDPAPTVQLRIAHLVVSSSISDRQFASCGPYGRDRATGLCGDGAEGLTPFQPAGEPARLVQHRVLRHLAAAAGLRRRRAGKAIPLRYATLRTVLGVHPHSRATSSVDMPASKQARTTS